MVLVLAYIVLWLPYNTLSAWDILFPRSYQKFEAKVPCSSTFLPRTSFCGRRMRLCELMVQQRSMQVVSDEKLGKVWVMEIFSWWLG